MRMRFTVPRAAVAAAAFAGLTFAAPSADAALIGHYRLEGNFNDSSGNNKHGTAGGTAPTFAAGQTGNGASFTGASANQFFTVPINIDPDVTPRLTMGAWVKSTAADSNRGIIGHDNGNYD